MKNPRIDTRQIVVIDVESSCWAPDDPEKPVGAVSEIIEIGAVVLDIQTLTVGQPWSAFVRPERSKVGRFCQGLTGITQEQLDGPDAVDLRTAVTELQRRFGTQKGAWASWGDYDRFQFIEELQAKGLRYYDYFGRRHLNVKTLYALAYNLESEVGMARALDHARLPLVGKHHSAGCDAANIARLLAHLLNACRALVPRVVEGL